jgi:signal transduction histidine kinase
MSVRLQLARRLVVGDLDAAVALLDEVDREVRAGLDRLRALANRIFPSLLEARGLPDALRAAATTTGVPAKVVAESVGRHPAEVEAAAYFACRAALECVAAGATAAAGATIRVTEEAGALKLAIDHVGSGLEGAADRIELEGDWVEALGGVLAIEPGPGGGTRVAIMLPLG